MFIIYCRRTHLPSAAISIYLYLSLYMYMYTFIDIYIIICKTLSLSLYIYIYIQHTSHSQDPSLMCRTRFSSSATAGLIKGTASHGSAMRRSVLQSAASSRGKQARSAVFHQTQTYLHPRGRGAPCHQRGRNGSDH